jgi:tetrahydromethanopterin S-methyltransferase subunit G
MNDQEPKYFTKFREELYVRLDGHAEQIAYLTEKTTVMDGDIKNIYKRLDNMDIRFDNMDKRFDGMDKRLDNMDKRFDNMDKRFDKIDIRFNNLEKKVDFIGSQLTESLGIVNRKADSLYVDDINNRTKNIEKVVFA